MDLLLPGLVILFIGIIAFVVWANWPRSVGEGCPKCEKPKVQCQCPCQKCNKPKPKCKCSCTFC